MVKSVNTGRTAEGHLIPLQLILDINKQKTKQNKTYHTIKVLKILSFQIRAAAYKQGQLRHWCFWYLSALLTSYYKSTLTKQCLSH